MEERNPWGRSGLKPRIRFRHTFLALLSLLHVVAPCLAAGQTIRSFSLSVDNDGFVFWKPPRERTDWYYTHGLKASAVLGWAPRLAKILGDQDPEACPTGSHPDSCILTKVEFGQEIYTPASLFSASPPVRDRPYAGWLYVSAAVANLKPGQTSSLAVEVGVTGKPSLAGPVHRWFHRALGKYEPQGWEYQIPFELAFAFRYEANRTVSLLGEGKRPSLYLEPRGALELGTLRTGTTAGMSLRAGWNTTSSLEGSGPRPKPLHAILELGAEGEFVLRDLFLDGSTWGYSVKAERVPLVGRLRGRIQVGWKGLGLEFGATRSTNQFRDQLGPHTVGTIKVIVFP